MQNRDEIIAKGKWTFDENVTEVFDDMLERSIPGYSEMRKLCYSLSLQYCKPNTHIVDLGCSTGGAIAKLVPKVSNDITFIGVEISKPMREKARERFQGYPESKVKIIDCDLREGYPKVSASVVISCLTLQFIPIEYRQNIINNVFQSLTKGGIFIFVEKILGSNAVMDDLLVKEYYKIKGENGYSTEQINSKRKSLEGVLVPVTSKWNEDMLKNTGFTEIECFWRVLNFAGWVAIK